MRNPRLSSGCLLIVCALALSSLVTVAPASATTVDTSKSASRLSLPRPSWYTDALHKRILAAGPAGVELRLSSLQESGGPSAPTGALNPTCMGYSPPSISTSGVAVNAVSAGGCMVYPSQCSMNFIFTTGTSKYIGSAGHCAAVGQAVTMQVASRIDPTDTVFVTLAVIGTTSISVNNGIGSDFSLTPINPAFAVVPGVAGGAGPTGAWCYDPIGQPVAHYGHGYVFVAEQGDPKFGEVVLDASFLVPFTSIMYGYNWLGYGLPGDSGSEVMNDAGFAVGDLTHGLAVSGLPVPGLSFGTTMTGIFNILGGSYSMLTVDGRSVRCPTTDLMGLADI